MRGSVASLHSPDYAAVRAELVAMRQRAGLTQRDLAARLGLRHTWVGKSEQGERRVDLLELFAWCRACGEDAVALVARLDREILGSHPHRRTDN